LKAIQMDRKHRMTPAPSAHAVMTIRDAAAFLHCHTSTLYRLVKRGEIPAFRLGGSWRLTWDALERWMRESQGSI
jgi:excisionase family DNA binding protein